MMSISGVPSPSTARTMATCSSRSFPISPARRRRRLCSHPAREIFPQTPASRRRLEISREAGGMDRFALATLLRASVLSPLSWPWRPGLSPHYWEPVVSPQEPIFQRKKVLLIFKYQVLLII
jgi:hypothetical protein